MWYSKPKVHTQFERTNTLDNKNKGAAANASRRPTQK
jgi:hypothetical protein